MTLYCEEVNMYQLAESESRSHCDLSFAVCTVQNNGCFIIHRQTDAMFVCFEKGELYLSGIMLLKLCIQMICSCSSLSFCFVHQENVPEEERVPTMRENTYVRVCGHVRSFQGKRNVVAFNISPLEDMNQLTCHLLSVMYAYASTNMVKGLFFSALLLFWVVYHT